MRALATLFVIVVISTSVGTAFAANSSCSGWFPVDVIACKDSSVAPLQEEMDELFSKAHARTQGPDQSALSSDQEKWKESRWKNCKTPMIWFGWLTPSDMRRFRPCLVNEYEERLKYLAELVTPFVPETLAQLADANSTVSERTLRLYELGRKLYGQRRWGGAVAQFDRALREQPIFAEAYLARGKAYLLLQNNTRAMENFRTAEIQLASDKKTELKGLVDLADLQQRKRFWEEQVFSCKVGTSMYPSKNDNKYDPMRRYRRDIPKSDWEKDYISDSNCDDGDMAFFNGLLCLAGDPRGCDGVALAQETKSGRWWRAKRRIGESEDSSYSSFSTEAGLGVLMYLAKTADRTRFDPWLTFIGTLPRTYSPLPSYCPHKECVFKIIDCPLLVTVASRFEQTSKALSVCSPLQYLGLPAPDEIAKQLEDTLRQLTDLAARFESLHGQIADKVGTALGLPNVGQLLPAPAKELRNQSDLIFKRFREALEKILGPEIGEAAAQLAQQIALVNSVVNSVDAKGFKVNASGKISYESGNVRVDGANITVSGQIAYNPNGEHIAGVEVFLLRSLGYSSAQLNAAAQYAYERDRDNPFFEYLAHGRSPRMLQLILSKCPSIERPSVVRFQWFPERGEDLQGDTNAPAWAQSMYWDCIFLAHLYEEPVTAQLGRKSNFDPFDVLADSLRDMRRFLNELTNSANGILSWIRKMEDAARPDKAFCNANPNNDLCKLIPPDMSFCDKNPNNDVCRWLPRTAGGGLPIPGGNGGLPIPGGGGGLPIPGGGGGLPIPGGGGGLPIPGGGGGLPIPGGGGGLPIPGGGGLPKL